MQNIVSITILFHTLFKNLAYCRHCFILYILSSKSLDYKAFLFFNGSLKFEITAKRLYAAS
ncbi:hypothetical protein, partial [uncultured Prevotella sp.]|uniref:hypothetical protein n=1 Tax=uncultured Prevotella sp. TaxID=159272 RepID=UPI0026193833